MRVHSQKWLLKTIVVVAFGYLVATFVWASGFSFINEVSGSSSETTKQAAVAGDNHTVRSLHVQTMSDGRQPCSDCHEAAVASFKRTTHAKTLEGKDEALACGTCHAGNLADHSNDTSTLVIQKLKKQSVMEVNKMCLSCHETVDDRSHANMSEHQSAGVGCVSCHNVHPTAEHEAKMIAGGQNAMFRGKSTELCISCHPSKGAEFSQTTHHRLKEGVMECSTCHNPHGSSEIKLLRADRKEVCVQCHQDKRGPFTFEHGAMLDEKGCVTCHEPHGGGGIHMLKARDPKTLCMSCHAREAIGMHGVSGLQYNGSVPVSGLTTAGDCTRCHAEIHGSNSTPFLHR